MKRSDSINEISAALASAQEEIKNPSFDSTNPHFRNKFASLAAVRNCVVPVMARHGVFVSQELTSTESGVACLTVLSHKSGQWIEFGPLVMPVAKADAQGFGSASTYCKRYSLMAVAGVVGDEDDDGNAAANTRAPAKSNTPSDRLIAVLTAIGKAQTMADLDAVKPLLKDLNNDEKGQAVQAGINRRNQLTDLITSNP